MKRPIYIVLCGLPGSGKSTLREQIEAAMSGPPPIWSLSTDDCIEQAAKEAGKTYSEVFATQIGPATDFVKVVRATAIRDLGNIIHDQTNLTAKKRAACIAGLPESYVKVCLSVMVSEELRQDRLWQRPGKVIPPLVDLQMRNSWEEPTFSEGFEMIYAGSMWESMFDPINHFA